MAQPIRTTPRKKTYQTGQRNGKATVASVGDAPYVDEIGARLIWRSPTIAATDVVWSRKHHAERRVVEGVGVPALLMVRSGACLKTVKGIAAVGDVNSALLFGSEGECVITHPFGDLNYGTDFFFDPDLTRSMIAEFDPSGARDPKSEFRRIGVSVTPQSWLLYRSTIAHLRSGDVHDDLLVEESFLTLLWNLIASSYENRSGINVPLGSSTTSYGRRKAAARIPDLASYLSANSEKNSSLEQLGQVLGCTPWYTCRLFQRVVGTSISRYVVRLRLRHALRRVLRRDSDFTVIALDSGFSSHSHFTTAFRKEFGIVPSRVRSEDVRDLARALLEELPQPNIDALRRRARSL